MQKSKMAIKSLKNKMFLQKTFTNVKLLQLSERPLYV